MKTVDQLDHHQTSEFEGLSKFQTLKRARTCDNSEILCRASEKFWLRRNSKSRIASRGVQNSNNWAQTGIQLLKPKAAIKKFNKLNFELRNSK